MIKEYFKKVKMLRESKFKELEESMNKEFEIFKEATNNIAKSTGMDPQSKEEFNELSGKLYNTTNQQTIEELRKYFELVTKRNTMYSKGPVVAEKIQEIKTNYINAKNKHRIKMFVANVQSILCID